MERYVGEKVMGILGEETNYVCTLIILVLWYCGHVVLLAKKQIMLAVDNCPPRSSCQMDRECEIRNKLPKTA